MRNLMEDYWKKAHIDGGYELLYTPHMASLDLWKTSGHCATPPRATPPRTAPPRTAPRHPAPPPSPASARAIDRRAPHTPSIEAQRLLARGRAHGQGEGEGEGALRGRVP